MYYLLILYHSGDAQTFPSPLILFLFPTGVECPFQVSVQLTHQNHGPYLLMSLVGFEMLSPLKGKVPKQTESVIQSCSAWCCLVLQKMPCSQYLGSPHFPSCADNRSNGWCRYVEGLGFQSWDHWDYWAGLLVLKESSIFLGPVSYKNCKVNYLLNFVHKWFVILINFTNCFCGRMATWIT